MIKDPCVYIMANKRNGTLYTGVTSDLQLRVYQHKNGTFDGFSKRYGTKLLVWFEIHSTMEEAIEREKEIKRYDRVWKTRLVQIANPDWSDLSLTLF